MLRRLMLTMVSAVLTVGGVVAVAVPAAASTVTVATRSTSLGLILVDGHGRTVYLFTRDTKTHSACSATCQKTWPRVISTTTPRAGSGTSKAKLGRLSTHQVTYNGHPLYYYGGDRAAGQTRGQGRSSFSGHWWVLSPQGAAGTGTTIRVGQTAAGSALIAPSGRTLYLLTADGANHTTCSSTCAGSWPPLLTTGKPHAGTGLSASLVGTALRSNGTRQVTYNGHPLYSYAGDSATGQANGESVYAFNGYWYVVNAAGSAV